ncbi:MAG: putative motility protein [Lachnospiraceae bacterium]|nr:putative motility protein [Lachnospiraceae bacterium]MDD6504066.1 putative motility protein [Lachnospiraceae bacterium]
MEISGMNAALSAVNSASPSSVVGLTSMKMLSNSIEASEQMGADFAKMMENSVTPYIGGNIDLSV